MPEQNLPSPPRETRPAVLDEPDEIVARLRHSRRQLRQALSRLRSRARDLTPAEQIRDEPVLWVAGALCVGVLLGVLSR